MDVISAIEKRRSTRDFSEKNIDDSLIEKLLHIATLAPSAGNLQSWFFVVIRKNSIKEALVEATNGQEYITSAPVIITGCADVNKSASKYGERGKQLYAIQDTTLAMYNLWLAAIDNGLSCAWLGALDEQKTRVILDLPSNLRPIILLSIGYSKKTPEAPERKKISNVYKTI
jgi:nitroreductase